MTKCWTPLWANNVEVLNLSTLTLTQPGLTVLSYLCGSFEPIYLDTTRFDCIIIFMWKFWTYLPWPWHNQVWLYYHIYVEVLNLSTLTQPGLTVLSYLCGSFEPIYLDTTRFDCIIIFMWKFWTYLPWHNQVWLYYHIYVEVLNLSTLTQPGLTVLSYLCGSFEPIYLDTTRFDCIIIFMWEFWTYLPWHNQVWLYYHIYVGVLNLSTLTQPGLTVLSYLCGSFEPIYLDTTRFDCIIIFMWKFWTYLPWHNQVWLYYHIYVGVLNLSTLTQPGLTVLSYLCGSFEPIYLDTTRFDCIIIFMWKFWTYLPWHNQVWLYYHIYVGVLNLSTLTQPGLTVLSYLCGSFEPIYLDTTRFDCIIIFMWEFWTYLPWHNQVWLYYHIYVEVLNLSTFDTTRFDCIIIFMVYKH